VRPDWAKKLADARAHTLRRAAAATALHNAAYVLGNSGEGPVRGGLTFGRRRRTLFSDSPSASGTGTPRFTEGTAVAQIAGKHILICSQKVVVNYSRDAQAQGAHALMTWKIS